MTDYATHHFKAASGFTVSVGYDRRLAPFDIDASIAHARMLGAQGVIPAADAQAIVEGLAALRAEAERGDFPWRDEFEDVHMNIERRLAETIGEPAARLHTARSRNDQVAAATRLYARNAIDEAARAIRALQRALVDKAGAHATALMPGYTHLQRAQPVLFAHHLLAYFEALERDAARLADCRRRVNVSPLGSGALAGVPYPIDREAVAAELGFEGVSANSMDAVSDRDYLAELLAAAAVCMSHLSRLAEDIVLWTTHEFGFASLGAEWVTGSSMMPQKRNPDFAELARGKTGRVYGNLIALLTVLKGLPMTYNRDLQEDKEPLFDTMDTLLAALEACRGMIDSLRVDEARMAQAASDPAMLATDLADYLAAKGVPFREAHAAVSALTETAAERNLTLAQLPLDDYRARHPAFDAGVFELTAERSAAARDVPGGTAPARVAAAIAAANRRLQDADA